MLGDPLVEEVLEWEEWSEEEADPSPEHSDVKDLEEQEDTFTTRSSAFTSSVEKMIKNVEDLDIMKLDVKVSKTKTDKVEDVDFFADMKPEIPKAASALEQFEEKLRLSPARDSSQVRPLRVHTLPRTKQQD